MKASGERIAVFITTKLADYGGEITILGIVTDITKRRHTEKYLREKDIKLEQQSRNLEERNVALGILLEQCEEEKSEIMAQGSRQKSEGRRPLRP